jgi:3-hydroxyacyl-CoA dehydrogenase/enoyl-CoA hydratase/3-hydroxybutyryl-CoA epimerase
VTPFDYIVDQDGIATVVFDTPDKQVNVWSRATLDELENVLAELAGREDLAAIVFRSGKPDTFIAGADIDMLAQVRSAEDAEGLARRGQAAFQRVADLSAPTVAAIHGACLGGGLEFALACSFRVASDDVSTRLGFPEVQLGIVPAWGGTQRAARLVGLQNALYLILTGERVGQRTALRMGLVDRIVPSPRLSETAYEMALAAARGREIPGGAQRGSFLSRVLDRNPLTRRITLSQARKRVLDRTGGHYPAPFAAIDVIETGLSAGMEAGLEAEARAVARLFETPASRNLMTLYLRREAAKSPPERGSAAPVRRVGVLGAGVMGGGIAEVAAFRGFQVRLKDIALDRVAEGLADAARIARVARRRGAMTAREARDLMHRISGTIDYGGFGRIDLTIETVIEDMGVKRRVVAEAERAAPRAVLATNTSSLRVDDIAQGLAEPDRFGGLHFFNPVEKMPLVEVVRGVRTSDDAIATLHRFAVNLGKIPIMVRDGPGFWVNRLLMPYLNEAAHLWAEGVSIEELDGALEAFGLPVGPLALLDEVGLDIAAKAGVVLEKAFPDRMRPHPLLQRLVNDGRLGKKSGRGFYLYQDGRRKAPDRKLRGELGLEARRSPAAGEGLLYAEDELVARCLYPMINEAARALDEAIVESPAMGDLALVLGIGWPPFRGGLLQWADEVGIGRIAARLDEWASAVGPRLAPSKALRRRAGWGGFYAVSSQPAASSSRNEPTVQPRLEGL